MAPPPPPATSQEQVTCATDGVPIRGMVTQVHPLHTLRAEPTGSINDQGERSVVAPGRERGREGGGREREG